MKLNGKVDDREVQALAAEQSQIIKQLIVANSQLETKLYKHADQRTTTKGGWTIAPDSQLWRNTTASSIARGPYHSESLVRGRLVVERFATQGGINNAATS